jgi:hypothetical protein
MSGTANRPAPGAACRAAAAKQPVTGRRQKPCSHPPKPRTGAYDRRPGAGPGRTNRTHCHGDGRRPVRMVLPDEPPALPPAAARALLRILLKAHAAQQGDQETGRPATGRPKGDRP